MKELVVLSGKGGTGKTSIAASLAVFASNKVMADCDVDAADLNLLLASDSKEENCFTAGKIARIDTDACLGCNICAHYCRFEAIRDCVVSQARCEGCGLCALVCPVQAVNMEDDICGKWFISDTKYGILVHARLKPGRGNSGKLVALVRQQARQIAESSQLEYIITDGPPGTGCPVISSLSGTSMALLVTEPTLSRVHDLERIIAICRHFDVPHSVCINQYDLNMENSNQIERYCNNCGIEIVGRIAVDDRFSKAIIAGIPVAEYTQEGPAVEIKKVWNALSSNIKKENNT